MMSACPSCVMHLSILNLYYTSLMINDDIDAIIQRGEVELNSKYEGGRGGGGGGGGGGGRRDLNLGRP